MKTRKVTISSYFEASSEKIWEKIQDVATLVEICKPLAMEREINIKLQVLRLWNDPVWKA